MILEPEGRLQAGLRAKRMPRLAIWWGVYRPVVRDRKVILLL